MAVLGPVEQQTLLTPPLRVETLANGGDGLAHDQGRVIFIPHTAVGDVVRCRIVREQRDYAHAVAVEFLQQSTSRRHPPCPVAGDCGGCQWQHLPYNEQLDWKEQLFRQTLTHKYPPAEGRFAPLVPAPAEWHYRSRAQVKCHAQKSTLLTGFYRPRSRYVVPVERCPLLPESLNRLLAELRECLSSTPYVAQIPQIDLASDDRGKNLAVVHYIGPHNRELAGRLAQLSGSADLFIQGRRREQLTPIRGDGLLAIQVDPAGGELEYAVGGFAQINLEQNRKLVAMVLDMAAVKGGERVLDLYCGMGNFALPLAAAGAQVVGIEEAAASIRMACNNARRWQLAEASFHCRPAEGALADFSQSGSFDLVILDPPRSGAYQVMKELIAQPVKNVIYVSCNPQTLARDLQRLLYNGYQLVSSCPIDMFPQTYHCESVSLLRWQE